MHSLFFLGFLLRRFTSPCLRQVVCARAHARYLGSCVTTLHQPILLTLNRSTIPVSRIMNQEVESRDHTLDEVDIVPSPPSRPPSAQEDGRVHTTAPMSTPIRTMIQEAESLDHTLDGSTTVLRSPVRPPSPQEEERVYLTAPKSTSTQTMIQESESLY
jgi:hypothetical protein